MYEILIGVISGTLTALGMGGGTVLILLLTLILGVPQNTAQAANLMFFIPTAITAIILNIKNKNINFKVGYIIIIFGVIGAILGAKLSSKIQAQNLKKFFGIFIIFITINEIRNFYKQYIKK